MPERALTERIVVLVVSVLALVGIGSMLFLNVLVIFGDEVPAQIGPLSFTVSNPKYPLWLGTVLVAALWVLHRDRARSLLERAKGYLEGRGWAVAVTAVAVWHLALFTWIKVGQHLSFHTGAYDLSLFDYAVANTLRGDFMHTEMLGRSFLSEHVSLTVLLAVPFYLIHDGPMTLLVLQAAAVAASGVFVGLLGREVTQNRLVALLLVVLWFNYSFLVKGLLFDAHVEMAEPLLLLGALYFLIKDWDVGFWICCVLALVTKEEMGIYLVPLAAYVGIARKRWKTGLALGVASIVWTAVALKVIVPSAAPGVIEESRFLANWAQYGSSYSEIALNVVRQPLTAMGAFFSVRHLNLIVWLGLLPLLAWREYLIAVPGILLNLTSQIAPQNELGIYYSAPIIPFVFFALMVALRRLEGWSAGRLRWAPRRLMAVLTVALVVAGFGRGYAFYRPDRTDCLKRQALNAVPAGRYVVAQSCFVPHLARSNRMTVFRAGHDYVTDQPDYYIVDRTEALWPFADDDEFRHWTGLFSGLGKWEDVYERDGLQIVRSKPKAGEE